MNPKPDKTLEPLTLKSMLDEIEKQIIIVFRYKILQTPSDIEYHIKNIFIEYQKRFEHIHCDFPEFKNDINKDKSK